MHEILIVEDDHDLADITRLHLEHAGYKTSIAYTGAQAIELLNTKNFSLILLDVVLPDMTGHEFCTTVREKSLCPIIFISCLDDNQTIVSALTLGGDDYIVKPISYEQLLARTEANIRRSELYQKQQRASENAHLRRYPGFTIDTDTHTVVLADGTAAPLSSIEYNLLLYLSDHPGVLQLYNDLYRAVWDSESLGDIRTVMVHISNLRKKIDPAHTGIIQTVRGAGYIFTGHSLESEDAV